MPEPAKPGGRLREPQLALRFRELHIRYLAARDVSRQSSGFHRSQVFDLLEFLIRNRERVVSKDELIGAVWSGRIIADEALTTRLNVARNAVGDTGHEQRLIKTLPRKGFRFIGAVQEAPGSEVVAGDPVATLTLPDKPSIAILPFTNLSSDPEQEYFADGMVEDIITGLSRSKTLFVIARNSTFTYKGKPVDIKRVGRELGVHYVLEGSVRKAGKRIRVTAQLIDASTDVHIWADKFDSDLEDIFDLQDRLTGNVVGAISPQLERAEIERARRKPTENLQAYDYYLRAQFLTYQNTREGNVEALRLARIAISLDPSFALAHAFAANTFGQKKGFGWVVDAARNPAVCRTSDTARQGQPSGSCVFRTSVLARARRAGERGSPSHKGRGNRSQFGNGAQLEWLGKCLSRKFRGCD
jgi:TolB-like protein